MLPDQMSVIIPVSVCGEKSIRTKRVLNRTWELNWALWNQDLAPVTSCSSPTEY